MQFPRRVLSAFAFALLVPLGGTIAATPAAGVPAVAAKTTVTLKLTGCKSCSVRFVHATGGNGEPVRDYWHSKLHKVNKHGVVTITLVRWRTVGMSFELIAPWDTNDSMTPNIVTRYRGKAAGDTLNARQAKARKFATGCWAGTTRKAATLHARVTSATVRNNSGDPAKLAVAWMSPQTHSQGSTYDTWHGGIGNQDAWYCPG